MSGLELIPALFSGIAAGGSSLGGVASAVSSGLGLAGTILGASQAQSAAKAEAREMERRANEETAVSQRDAAAKRREGELLMSRQRASAAASGGSTDPSLIAMMADADSESEYNAQTALYRGASSAGNLQTRAANKRASASTMMPAAILRASTSLLSDYGRARERIT
jgi:hypothetical protein